MAAPTLTPDRAAFRAALGALASKTQGKLPSLNGRVEKACKLVLGNDVELHTDGTALVHSLTDPTRAYQVTGAPATCQCQDYDRAPEHLCCHRLAVGFTRKLQALMPRTDVPDAGGPSLPEAPVSITLKATLHGHEVLVTLRGTDFASVRAEVEEASQWLRSQQPQAASPTPRNSEGSQEPERHYCPRHGVEMRQSHKDGRSWWSHKTAQGWCKGK
jgi:hypothetical protein